MIILHLKLADDVFKIGELFYKEEHPRNEFVANTCLLNILEVQFT